MLQAGERRQQSDGTRVAGVSAPPVALESGAIFRETIVSSDYRARYYDPKAGRFISEDPLEFAGGEADFYAYVGNDPLFYVDPLGLRPLTACEKLKLDQAGRTRRDGREVSYLSEVVSSHLNSGPAIPQIPHDLPSPLDAEHFHPLHHL